MKKKVLVYPLTNAITNYKLLMFKMKINYMSWIKGVEFFELFYQAISKTLKQQELETV